MSALATCNTPMLHTLDVSYVSGFNDAALYKILAAPKDTRPGNYFIQSWKPPLPNQLGLLARTMFAIRVLVTSGPKLGAKHTMNLLLTFGSFLLTFGAITRTSLNVLIEKNEPLYSFSRNLPFIANFLVDENKSWLPVAFELAISRFWV